ncbi:MAG: glycosyltransferase family 2 protein [Bacteroidota bacterium]
MMAVKMQTWSIIIFAYNEEDAIRHVINKCLAVLDNISPGKNELIIVNDGSTDKTPGIINETIHDKQHVRVINHPKNIGIGKSLMDGYRAAKHENLCAIPGDGQFDPEELIPYSTIPAKTILSFYRTEKTRYTLYRKLLSHCNKLLNRHLLRIKIKDVNWIKVYKKGFFDNINPVLSSLLVESEICAKMLRNDYNIIEIPSVYHPRKGGKSKGGSVKTVFMAVHEIFKLYVTLNFRK